MLQSPAEEVMQRGMTEYGRYITINRAIPDVRDGLKPVQRRILWSMHELGLKPDRGSVKCARIVGDVIGLYHPHGDASTYYTLVAMATPWGIRYPLVQSVGSFGSILGDPPAAYRYTEAGVTELGFGHFVDKKYFDYQPNFDGKAKEPEVLSALLPMLLVNGYSGISVGFSGNLPSHNILEVAKLALAHHNKESFTLSGPEKEYGTFLLSKDEDIAKVYETGEGSLQFCSMYVVDDKAKKVTVTGFAPYISLKSIMKDLHDLIEKEIVEVSDFTSESVQVEIMFKDTRLLESRVIPAISSTESYQFHVIHENDIELMNVKQIVDAWHAHRILLWDRNIADHLATAKQDFLEIATQIAIIQNVKAFMAAIQQATLEDVKKALGKFLDIGMIDYALNLKVSQILKFNEVSLTDKKKVAEERVARWEGTTALAELGLQLVELVDYYEKLNLPKNTVKLAKDKLPTFKREMIKNHWFVVNEKGWEFVADQPTRGKGFTGVGLTECSEWFGIVSNDGVIETYSAFDQPKRMKYEKEQHKPLIALHDRPSVIVGLGDDGTIICRQGTHNGIRQFSKVSLQQVVQLEAEDILVLKFFNGKALKFTYDELLPKCTSKVASGWKPKLLGIRNAIVTQLLGCYKGQAFLKDQGTFVVKDALKKDVIGVAKRNLVISASGQRSIVFDNMIPKDTEMIIRL